MMKSRFLITLTLMAFLLSITETVHAQIIKGEVFIGGNASQVDGDECFGYKKLGFQGGVGALIPVTNFMDIGLEVLYNQKGAYKKDSITYNSSFVGRYDLSLNYVEVPLMVYLTDKEKYSIGLGLSYGRLVGLVETVNGQSTNVSIGDGNLTWKPGCEDPNFDLSHIHYVDSLGSHLYDVSNSTTYRGHDFSLCADIRARIWKGFHAELRYQYSLARIRTRLFYRNFTETEPLSTRWQYNNELTLRIVYIFNEQRSESNKKIQKEKP